MKKNIVYIIIGALFAIWLYGEYVVHTRSHAINILMVIAVILLSYKMISGEPRRYQRRRGLR